MTTDQSNEGLWVMTVGHDFNLYYRTANDGDITKSKDWALWGTGSKIRGEVSVMHLEGDDALEVFTTDITTGHVMCKYSKQGNPNGSSDGWFDLGGVVAGSPVALPTTFNKAKPQYYIVAVGSWGSLGGGANDKRVPAFQPEKINCSTDQNGRIDVVAVAVTNDIYHRYFNGSAWSSWTSVGKNVGGSRPVCWTTKDRVDIVAKDNDDIKLYHTACDSNVWLGWQKVADTTTDFDPAGCYYADDASRLDLAVISATGSMMHNFLSIKSGQLSSWRSDGYAQMGGCLSSSPKIATRKGARVDFFARGMNSAMFYKCWDKGWIDWKSLGGGNSGKPS